MKIDEINIAFQRIMAAHPGPWKASSIGIYIDLIKDSLDRIVLSSDLCSFDEDKVFIKTEGLQDLVTVLNAVPWMLEEIEKHTKRPKPRYSRGPTD